MLLHDLNVRCELKQPHREHGLSMSIPRSARNGEQIWHISIILGLVRHKQNKCSILHHYSYILGIVLVDYFMHTLFMQITSNLFDCNFMLPLHHQCQLLHGQHPVNQRMDLHDLWVLSRNLRRQWQSVVLELIEILCDLHLMSCDGFVHFQIH